ncbi:hypothetical protein [Paracoccus luteus]|uniref:hypothetical protein n=1 Tax=Paracoccus luteus TaxID=2508543 RepID=UPI001FE784D5|nr:hypothetical protein [Paracoccus luteus]
MDLIRPELVERVRPWREVIAAGLTAAAGAWLFSLGGLVFQPMGLAVIGVAAVWGLGALRRRRFQMGIAAPGLVEVEEGAVRYFSARALGGEIALRDLTEIRLLRLDGHAHWRLKAGGQALLIPVEAAGAATLADAFAALPGFDLGRAASALSGNAAVATVWRRG